MLTNGHLNTKKHAEKPRGSSVSLCPCEHVALPLLLFVFSAFFALYSHKMLSLAPPQFPQPGFFHLNWPKDRHEVYCS